MVWIKNTTLCNWVTKQPQTPVIHENNLWLLNLTSLFEEVETTPVLIWGEWKPLPKSPTELCRRWEILWSSWWWWNTLWGAVWFRRVWSWVWGYISACWCCSREQILMKDTRIGFEFCFSWLLCKPEAEDPP